MVPVARVREDVLDHAMWTVLVVSLLVEARVVKVAEVTAHVMYFRFSPSLSITSR